MTPDYTTYGLDGGYPDYDEPEPPMCEEDGCDKYAEYQLIGDSSVEHYCETHKGDDTTKLPTWRETQAAIARMRAEWEKDWLAQHAQPTAQTEVVG